MLRGEGKKFEVVLFRFPGGEDEALEGGGVESFLILEVGRKVDAVVFADKFDGLGRQRLGFGTDADVVEDVPTSGEVTGESTGADVGQFGQLLFADEAVFIVIINHCLAFRG